MKRLLKKADEQLEQQAQFDVEGAKIAVDALNETVQDIFDQYKKLFNQLNSLYQEYPSLYDEMKKVVRFPTEETAKDITDMRQDLDDLATHYEDTQYLSQIMDIFKE